MKHDDKIDAQEDGSASLEFDLESPTCPEHTTESTLVRKLDVRLMPVVILLYLWSFLDRINISNAITLGLQSRLHLQGNDVNVALVVFYVPYIVFEIPSNYVLKRVDPHIWLSGSMVLFGIIVLCHGFVTNYSGLLAARFFLGLAEAGIMPGCSYLLTMWYKPNEILQRYAIYLNAVTLAGAFGSLLASGIAKMDGIRGHAGWQWIFIIEGIATVVIGFLAFFMIPDFPHTAKWLSEDEKRFMQARLIDQSDMKTESTLGSELGIYFSSWRSYIAGLLYLGCNIVGYSVSYFLPTIIKGFHYSRIETQLHAVPPFAAAFGWSILLSFLVFRLAPPLRLAFALFSFCLVFIGVGILFNIRTNLSAEYAAVFLIVAGVFGGIPIVLVSYFMTLERNWQRAIGTAYMIGFGNIGGIIATFSFTADDAPYYHRGYSIITFGICLAAACTVITIADRLWQAKRSSR